MSLHCNFVVLEFIVWKVGKDTLRFHTKNERIKFLRYVGTMYKIIRCRVAEDHSNDTSEPQPFEAVKCL